jgi:hypothetical protein
MFNPEAVGNHNNISHSDYNKIRSFINFIPYLLVLIFL